MSITVDNIEKLAQGLGVEVFELFVPSELAQTYTCEVSEARMTILVRRICAKCTPDQGRLLQLFLDLLAEWEGD